MNCYWNFTVNKDEMICIKTPKCLMWLVFLFVEYILVLLADCFKYGKQNYESLYHTTAYYVKQKYNGRKTIYIVLISHDQNNVTFSHPLTSVFRCDVSIISSKIELIEKNYILLWNICCFCYSIDSQATIAVLKQDLNTGDFKSKPRDWNSAS